MLTYEEDSLVMIPMAMNAFYQNIHTGSVHVRYTRLVIASENFVEKLLENINGVADDKTIVFDLDCIDYAFHQFAKFRELSRPLIFININADTLQGKLNDDLPDLMFNEDYSRAVLNMEYDGSIDEVAKDDPFIASHKVYVDIVNSLIDRPEKAFRLDSSGMYSNMYVNIKKLFLDPERLYAVLYGLAKEIEESGIRYDGLISSSKNGALLAYLLGMMLDVKSVHISGIGPKFAMNIGNLQKDIMKRKNYIYVFDFRCTGTEMKILSALVNTNDAYLKGSLGIAVYRDDSNDKNGKMFYLVDLIKEEIPYKVAGEEEDIAILLKN